MQGGQGIKESKGKEDRGTVQTLTVYLLTYQQGLLPQQVGDNWEKMYHEKIIAAQQARGIRAIMVEFQMIWKSKKENLKPFLFRAPRV